MDNVASAVTCQVIGRPSPDDVFNRCVGIALGDAAGPDPCFKVDGHAWVTNDVVVGGVYAVATIHRIRARDPEKLVITIAAKQFVRAIVARQAVIASAAEDCAIAPFTEKRVVEIGSDDIFKVNVGITFGVAACSGA